ncbi:MAG: ribosome hibernation-promoting factor, HPF/YfiA family [Saezia sp.]
MNLTISGHHIEVTPALREYVNAKLEKVTKHADQVLDLTVVLTVDNSKEKELRQKASCATRFKGGDVFVETADADLYAAIDALSDKLIRQLSRLKEKDTDRKRTAESSKYME